jgi:pimeloyl-ACP methyl ester carboxylesterase
VAIEQQVLSAGGQSFAALTCGDSGPLALCLHGFPDSAWTWRHLLPELGRAGFRAVAPWLRGYHPTDVPADGDYRVATLAADANALHEAVGGDGDAVLIGHDWGAIAAYAAAAAAPDRWSRVVAMAVPPPAVAASAFGHYDQLKRSFYVLLFQTPFASIVAQDDFAFIERLWRDWSPAYDPSRDLPAVKEALRHPANLEAAIGYYRALFSDGGGNETPPQPTLYLHGNDDGCFGADLVRDSARHLSEGSKLEIVSDAGHFLHLERPDEVDAAIVSWVTG